MSTRWRYYESKRGNGFRGQGRGRGRGRGRGTSLTAISLPRDDHFHKGEQNEAYFKDKPLNPKEFRDETVLSLSFAQNMLGAAYYEQSSHLVKIMNDISEDQEFIFLKRLIEEVKPTMIIANRSQDLEFIKLLSARYAVSEKLDADAKETTQDNTESTIPTWDASLAYSTDEATVQEENEDEDDEAYDGPPAMLYKLPNNFFKMPRALQRLKMMVGSEDNTMSEEEKYTIVTMRFDIEAVNMMRSFGALLLFLDETRLGVEKEPLTVNPPIKSIKTLTLENLVDIDYNTIQALDILPKETETRKNAGQGKSLYSLLDRCRSTVGKKCLRKWFRNPTTDRQVLLSRQRSVHFFKQDWNAEVTAKIASILGKVKALNNVFQRFQSGTAKLIHWECFVSTVNALVDIMNIVRQTPISSEHTVETSLVKEVSEIAIIAGSIVNFAESKIQGRVTVMPGIDDELDKLRDIYENMPLVLTAVAKQEANRLGLAHYSNVSCVYIPLVGFVLSLPRDFSVESHQDMSLVYATSEELRVRNTTTERLDDEYGDILMKLIDSQTAIMLTLKTRIMKKKRSISKLLSVVSRIDALVALGLVAAENGWNCPALVDEPVIEALELFHPISALVVKKNFVPNQVSSGRNGIKASIITGPNACGKSIYMKSIGILAFLTHIGSFVPARHAKIGIVDRIVTRMFTVDSVLDGMSTFAKDVEQVALALRKATGNSLVIIDEFGKGTMTEVGLSLLASCMSHWMQKGTERCPHIFLSSHFHALPKYIPLNANIATFLTFTVLREPGGKIRYLFRLTPGMVDCSFAMAVAKEEGIPMALIGRACRIYKALKSGTPLKHVRAEVSNDDEEQLIADMDVVLEDEAGFMNAVESFVKRKKNTRTDKSSDGNSSIENRREREEREELPTSISTKHVADGSLRTHSVISSKSLASMDQLSIFDALLPKKKKKLAVKTEKNDGDATIESSRSPDPFGDDEENGLEHQKEQDVALRSRIPSLQRLASEEEKEQSLLSRRSTSARTKINNFETPKNANWEERGGIKRPRFPSTSELPVSAKTSRMAEDPKPYPLESQVLETPKQLSRNSSSYKFLEPRLPPLKESVLNRVFERSSQSTLFKTPTNDKRTPLANSSYQITPKDRSTNQLPMQTPRKESSSFRTPTNTHPDPNKSFNFINNSNDSIFKSQVAFNPNVTPRSSSRREMRSEDKKSSEMPKKSSQIHSSSTPIGSQFSIFNSQHSFPGNETQTTNDGMSFLDFFETRDSSQKKSESSKKSISNDSQGAFNLNVTPRSSSRREMRPEDRKSSEMPKTSSQIHSSVQNSSSKNFVFATPKNKISEKQRSFVQQKAQSSRQSISPSSVILGGLIEEDIQKTPLPRGDKPACFDFEFQITDDDPIYGNKGNRNSPVFDFLQPKDDDDDFLKSLLETEKSLRIDTSADQTMYTSRRK